MPNENGIAKEMMNEVLKGTVTQIAEFNQAVEDGMYFSAEEAKQITATKGFKRTLQNAITAMTNLFAGRGRDAADVNVEENCNKWDLKGLTQAGIDSIKEECKVVYGKLAETAENFGDVTKDLSAGQIAGIVIAGVVVAGALTAGGIYAYKHLKDKNHPERAGSTEGTEKINGKDLKKEVKGDGKAPNKTNVVPAQTVEHEKVK